MSSSPLRVLLIGIGGVGSLAGALADGLLQEKYRGQLTLTVLSRPDTAETKKATIESLVARGATVRHAAVTLADLTVALREQDVVVSSLGTPGCLYQRTYIDAAKAAGVKWFIPSEWGFDYAHMEKGGQVGLIADVKIDDLAAIKAHGMDWTSISTGAFSEYALSPVLGVIPAAHTIVFPASGKAAVTQTSLGDVGVIVADAIVTGRGRNQNIYTATDTFTYEQYADLIEKVTGQTWKRVVRTQEESLAAAKDKPFPIVEAFELLIGSPTSGVLPNPLAAWPREQTYNHQYGIKTSSTEDIIRRVLKV